MFLVAWITEVGAGKIVFDVTKYGAVADGKTDNNKVILAISKHVILSIARKLYPFVFCARKCYHF